MFSPVDINIECLDDEIFLLHCIFTDLFLVDVKCFVIRGPAISLVWEFIYSFGIGRIEAQAVSRAVSM